MLKIGLLCGWLTVAVAGYEDKSYRSSYYSPGTLTYGGSSTKVSPVSTHFRSTYSPNVYTSKYVSSSGPSNVYSSEHEPTLYSSTNQQRPSSVYSSDDSRPVVLHTTVTEYTTPQSSHRSSVTRYRREASDQIQGQFKGDARQGTEGVSVKPRGQNIFGNDLYRTFPGLLYNSRFNLPVDGKDFKGNYHQGLFGGGSFSAGSGITSFKLTGVPQVNKQKSDVKFSNIQTSAFSAPLLGSPAIDLPVEGEELTNLLGSLPEFGFLKKGVADPGFSGPGAVHKYKALEERLDRVEKIIDNYKDFLEARRERLGDFNDYRRLRL